MGLDSISTPTNDSATTTVMTRTSDIRMPEKLPTDQVWRRTISSSAAKVMMNSVMAEHRYPIMTPPMMRTDIRWTTVESSRTSPILSMAPTNAAATIAAELTGRARLMAMTMASATVSFAPEDTPRMKGPAMGLWKKVCSR